MSSLFQRGSTVRHTKTGGAYTVLLTPDAFRIEAGNEAAYAYRGVDGVVWARPQSEFEDGRFVANADSDRPGALLLTGTIVVALLSMLLGYHNQFARSGSVPSAIGGGVAQFLIAAAMALLLSIGFGLRSPRSRTKTVLWTSVILVLASICNLSEGVAGDLDRVARSINAAVPKMADAATRVDGATAGPGLLLTVRETLIIVDGSDLDRKEWKAIVVPRIRANALKNPSLMKLVSSGVTLAYRFSGRDGVLIDELRFTERDLYGGGP